MAEFHGQLMLRAEPREGGSTVLGRQAFRAPFHLSKPYYDTTTRTLIVQVVNPTAGILAGDRLESDVTVATGASLLLTTPSASRVFRMRSGEAGSEQRFHVEAGGWLEVWPEPLVPHRGSRFTQRTVVEVARGGAALVADMLLPGRIAHEELWSWDALTLGFEVSVDGVLAQHERLAQSGPELLALARLAGREGGAAFGNAIFVAPGADAARESGTTPSWRAAVESLHGDGTWVGVSPLRVAGAWSIKWITPDGIGMRDVWRAIRRALSTEAPALATDPRKL